MPGVAVWPWPAGTELHVRIAHAPEEEVDEAAVERRWEQMCRHNPRLFDAPILSVVRMDAGREIVCERSSYKLLAVQDEVSTNVEQLSVTGVIVGQMKGTGVGGLATTDYLLLGRRGARTRIYGGMWELAPSGGIDAPEARSTLCQGDLIEQLQREFEEETGSHAKLSGVRVAAVCLDVVAHSYDVVFACEMPLDDVAVGLDVNPERWEYAGLRWVPVGRLREFDRENAAEIITPTRAMMRFFGWA